MTKNKLILEHQISKHDLYPSVVPGFPYPIKLKSKKEFNRYMKQYQKMIEKEGDMEAELTNLLKCLRDDAVMALNDTWDRSDDGFKSQIELIDNFAKQFNLEL